MTKLNSPIAIYDLLEKSNCRECHEKTVCSDTSGSSVLQYAEYVTGIKKKFPKLKVGMIEAAFRFHWEDKTRFPAEDPRKDHGDLKKVLLDVMAACKARGTRIDIFQPEYSYERIEKTENGWEKMKAMERFIREDGKKEQ